MADALCGPSNALQSFQKHTQRDQTLQQDRISGPRHSPGQGFRSFDPRTGSLDADFHAFENAQPNLFQPNEAFFGQRLNHDLAFPTTAMAPPAVNWAADFQKMQINDQPIPAQQFRSEAPLILSNPGGWQQEFMRQRQNGTSSVAQGKQAVSNYQQNAMQSMQHLATYNSMQQQQFPMFDQSSAGALQQVPNQEAASQGFEQASAADWSKAFEEAFESVSKPEQKMEVQQDQILHQDGTYTNDHSQMHETPQNLQTENIRIGSDAIDYTEMQDRSADQDAQDAGALARVAGELLHNVQHESDTKFQNSQFLDLMRKIRDRQVEVRNNDFETIQGESISGAQMSVEPSTISPSTQQEDKFSFPDMNTVFEPDPTDTLDMATDLDPISTYSGPQSQIQALHPGGKLYPGSPGLDHPISMSGGIAPAVDERTTLA